jgi:RNA polymerase sigma-70 factor (ECF subfamily)
MGRALIQQALEAGRKAWPEIRLAEEPLGKFLGGRDASTQLADLYLACACLEGDRAALEALEKQVLSQVGSAVRKIDDSRDFATELTQLTRTRLLVGDGKPRLREYAGKGSLIGWTKAVAVRLALNEKRRTEREQPTDDDELPEIALPGEPTLDLVRKKHKKDFEAALREGLAALTAEQRTMLKMSVLDRVGVDRLSTVFHVHRATVARRLERAREELLENTRAALAKRLKTTPSELDSLLRALSSGIEVSLRRMF